MKEKIIWTIGHSTRTSEEFISILHSFKIELLADIRSYPGSKRYPHFNKENLQQTLSEHKIIYQHFSELGGRRKAVKDSINTVWRNDAFRGYADYMQTESFQQGIIKLGDAASKQDTVYMCSEAVWWRCHRSLVSDYLKLKGWKVMHIINKNKSEEHPYTAAAKIINGKLNYQDQQRLF